VQRHFGTDVVCTENPIGLMTRRNHLTLQLFFCFEVRALSGSLVSSTPE
jgi:hypothetical protein